MSYIALRDFDGFKKGDLIQTELVQDRLIRGRKIGLANSTKIGVVQEIKEVKEVKEVKDEILTEDVKEHKEVNQKKKRKKKQKSDELLTDNSSDVSVYIKED